MYYFRSFTSYTKLKQSITPVNMFLKPTYILGALYFTRHRLLIFPYKSQTNGRYVIKCVTTFPIFSYKRNYSFIR